MSRAWANGSTYQWRKTRAAVIARDRSLCQLKIDGTCTTTATCAHHVKGKAYGDNPLDIVAACQPCNLAVGDPMKRATDPQPTPRSNW